MEFRSKNIKNTAKLTSHPGGEKKFLHLNAITLTE